MISGHLNVDVYDYITGKLVIKFDENLLNPSFIVEIQL